MHPQNVRPLHVDDRPLQKQPPSLTTLHQTRYGGARFKTQSSPKWLSFGNSAIGRWLHQGGEAEKEASRQASPSVSVRHELLPHREENWYSSEYPNSPLSAENEALANAQHIRDLSLYIAADAQKPSWIVVDVSRCDVCRQLTSESFLCFPYRCGTGNGPASVSSRTSHYEPRGFFAFPYATFFFCTGRSAASSSANDSETLHVRLPCAGAWRSAKASQRNGNIAAESFTRVPEAEEGCRREARAG